MPATLLSKFRSMGPEYVPLFAFIQGDSSDPSFRVHIGFVVGIKASQG